MHLLLFLMTAVHNVAHVESLTRNTGRLDLTVVRVQELRCKSRDCNLRRRACTCATMAVGVISASDCGQRCFPRIFQPRQEQPPTGRKG